MNYVVIDMEWNQNPYSDNIKHGLTSEIIEIGAVKLDDNLHKLEEFHGLVKPKVFKKFEHHIRQILTYDEGYLIKNGYPFTEVCSKFREWCGKDFMLCTWGRSDIRVLQENIKYYGLEPVHFPFRYYDLQKIFIEKFLKNVKLTGYSLDKAVETLGIPEPLEFHSAINDARYTAAVMKKAGLDKFPDGYVYDTFVLPENKDDRIEDFHYGIYEEISEAFSSKAVAMSDKQMTEIKCPECFRKCVRRINWFSANSNTELAAGWCIYHGAMAATMKFRQIGHSGNVFVEKKIVRASAQDIDRIREKKHVIQQHRAEVNAKKRERASASITDEVQDTGKKYSIKIPDKSQKNKKDKDIQH